MAKNIPISIGLRAEGAAAIKVALRGVKESFVEMERDSLAATKDASKQRIAVLKDESKQKIALLKEESRARQEILKAETSFKRAINRKEGEHGWGSAGKALVKGEGFEGMMRAMGATGLAISAFSATINFASQSLKQFSSFIINDVIKPAMALETKAVQVANSSGGRITSEEVQSKARAAALKNNMDPMQLVDAAGIFQDASGDSQLSFDMMGTLGTLSKARGFDIKELTGLAGALYKPGMKKEELDQLLLMLTAQGETGSVTLGQQARLGGKMIAPAASLAGDYQTRIAMTSALLQSGRKGFGTAEEAATSLSTIMSDAMLHGKQLSPKSFVKDASGVEKLADPARFIADVYRKTQGNAVALHAMQLSEPTTKLIGAYKETYGEAFNASKAGGKSDTQAKEEAAKAVEDFIKSFATANTTMQSEEARRDAVIRTSGERFTQGMEQIKGKLAEELAPAVEKLANSFAEHSEEITTVAIMLAEALASLAQAAIDAVEWWDNLTGNKGEGDVLRRVIEKKNSPTHLPDMGDNNGYWLREKGVYSFIKGSKDGIDDAANSGLRSLWTLPGGKGIYERNNGSQNAISDGCRSQFAMEFRTFA